MKVERLEDDINYLAYKNMGEEWKKAYAGQCVAFEGGKHFASTEKENKAALIAFLENEYPYKTFLFAIVGEVPEAELKLDLELID